MGYEIQETLFSSVHRQGYEQSQGLELVPIPAHGCFLLPWWVTRETLVTYLVQKMVSPAHLSTRAAMKGLFCIGRRAGVACDCPKNTLELKENFLSRSCHLSRYCHAPGLGSMNSGISQESTPP